MRGLLYHLHGAGKQRLAFRLMERIANVRLAVSAPSVCKQCPDVSYSEDSSTYFWIALSTAEFKAALDLIHRQHTFHRLQSVPPARSIEQPQGSRGCSFPTSCAPSSVVLKTVSHRGTSAYPKRACVTSGYGYPYLIHTSWPSLQHGAFLQLDRIVVKMLDEIEHHIVGKLLRLAVCL